MKLHFHDDPAAHRAVVAALLLAVLAIVGSLFTGPAVADTIGAHLYTQHVDNRLGAKLNNATIGLYWRAEGGPLDGLTSGVFRNSMDRWSVYAGRTWQTDDQRWALFAGLASGYGKRFGQNECGPGKVDVAWSRCWRGGAAIRPLLAASMRLPITASTAARISLLPSPGQGHAGGVHFSIERALP
jgi:hypothetical protein